jgi:hypothetical protein
MERVRSQHLLQLCPSFYEFPFPGAQRGLDRVESMWEPAHFHAQEEKQKGFLILMKLWPSNPQYPGMSRY